jgi:hypothetical protein
MLKRYSVTLFALLSLSLLVACGGKAGSGGVALVIDGGEYGCGETVEPVLTAFGEGYEYAEGLNCAYDSVDKTFTYPHVTVYTVPLEEGDVISEIYTEDQSVATTEGVTVGMKKADVIAAHGDGFEDLGNLLVYRSPEQGALCFEMDGDNVIGMFVTTEAI